MAVAYLRLRTDSVGGKTFSLSDEWVLGRKPLGESGHIDARSSRQ